MYTITTLAERSGAYWVFYLRADCASITDCDRMFVPPDAESIKEGPLTEARRWQEEQR